MPLDPRAAAAAQLALALASIYNPKLAEGVAKGQIALDALLASLDLYREATGRPAGWKPSAAEWDTFIAEREARTIEALRTAASLPPTPTAH